MLSPLKPFMQHWSQSCPTLCDPMSCSLQGSSVHGIFQARVLEWVAISFSRRSSRPRDWIRVSRIVGRCSTVWATRKPFILVLKCYFKIFSCCCFFLPPPSMLSHLIGLWKLKHLSKINTSKMWPRYLIIYTFKEKKVKYTLWQLWSQLSTLLFFCLILWLFYLAIWLKRA